MFLQRATENMTVVKLLLFMASVFLISDAYKIDDYTKPLACDFTFKHKNKDSDICINEENKFWCSADKIGDVKINCVVKSDNDGNRLLSQGALIQAGFQCKNKTIYLLVDGNRESSLDTESCDFEKNNKTFEMNITLGQNQTVKSVNIVAGTGTDDKKILEESAIFSGKIKCVNGKPEKKGEMLWMLKAKCKEQPTINSVLVQLSTKIKSLAEIEVWGEPISCNDVDASLRGHVICKLGDNGSKPKTTKKPKESTTPKPEKSADPKQESTTAVVVTTPKLSSGEDTKSSGSHQLIPSPTTSQKQDSLVQNSTGQNGNMGETTTSVKPESESKVSASPKPKDDSNQGKQKGKQNESDNTNDKVAAEEKPKAFKGWKVAVIIVSAVAMVSFMMFGLYKFYKRSPTPGSDGAIPV